MSDENNESKYIGRVDSKDDGVTYGETLIVTRQVGWPGKVQIATPDNENQWKITTEGRYVQKSEDSKE